MNIRKQTVLCDCCGLVANRKIERIKEETLKNNQVIEQMEIITARRIRVILKFVDPFHESFCRKKTASCIAASQ